MELKDKLVYRILSGYVRVNINGEIYLIKGISPQEKYIAEELYESLLEEYSWDLMTDEQLYDYLIEEKLWSGENEHKLTDFKKNIEELQVKMFECAFQGKEKERTKKMIQMTRTKIKELNEKRHSFDNLCASGAATIEKNKYIIGLGICNEKGKKLFNRFNFHKDTFPLLDKIIIAYNKQTITMGQYRLMARTDPWRQYWGAKEIGQIFSKPISQLTEEQLTLISWSRLYDSVYQHPKCPSDDVIEDDDCLDGFLIKDKREREKDKIGQTAEDIVSKNPKIRNAQEIFITAETPEDVKKINELNSPMGASIKRQRDKVIADKGKVKETELPDVKQRIQMQINAEAFKAAKRQ